MCIEKLKTKVHGLFIIQSVFAFPICSLFTPRTIKHFFDVHHLLPVFVWKVEYFWSCKLSPDSASSTSYNQFFFSLFMFIPQRDFLNTNLLAWQCSNNIRGLISFNTDCTLVKFGIQFLKYIKNTNKNYVLKICNMKFSII